MIWDLEEVPNISMASSTSFKVLWANQSSLNSTTFYCTRYALLSLQHFSRPDILFYTYLFTVYCLSLPPEYHLHSAEAYACSCIPAPTIAPGTGWALHNHCDLFTDGLDYSCPNLLSYHDIIWGSEEWSDFPKVTRWPRGKAALSTRPLLS